jgi:hypothetical protein
MKNIFGLLSLVCILGSLPARAVGGESQGVLLAGQGLDWQRSGTEVQSVLTFPSTTFPVGTLTKVINGIEFNISGCSTPPDARFAVCTVKVKRLSQPSALFCSVWLDDKYKTLKMFALDAVHDGQGGFRFGPQPSGPPHEFTLACGSENPSKVSVKEWNALGAIGKCLLWPFPRQPEPGPPTCVNPPPPAFPPLKNDIIKFQSCVRAVRADYCGQGVSYTKDSTVIDLYDVPSAATHVPYKAFLLEANWNPKGAICILHARYVSLSPECRKKFPILVSLFGGTGKKAGKPDKEQRERTEGGGRGYKEDDDDEDWAGYKGSEYHCQSFDFRPDKCDPTGTCAKLKGFQDLLAKGYLMDDSLLQP